MTNTTHKVERKSHFVTVRLGDLRISQRAQRSIINTWTTHLSNAFDLNLVGTLTVSHREGVFWILDGQHRFVALRKYVQDQFGDEWADWTVVCDVFEGLDEEDEAHLFLELNNRRSVSAFDKFKVGVTAELPEPTDIDRVVRASGLTVAKGKRPNTISAVGALQFVYRLGDAPLLRLTITAIANAWEGIGFDQNMITGLGLFFNRYQAQVDYKHLVTKLGELRLGEIGVEHKAAGIRESRDDLPKKEAIAAAVTDIYNAGLRGKKRLTPWFKAVSA
jgi:hypothetical protein